MSNPTVKYTIIATILASLGGGTYFTYSCLEQKANEIDNQLKILAETLSPEFKLSKVKTESNIFTSSGTYKLTYTNQINKKISGELLVTYEANHGLMTLWGEDVTFTAKSEVKGNIPKILHLKTKDNIFSTLEGVVKNDSIIIKENISNLSFIVPASNSSDKGVSIKIKSISNDIEFKNANGTLTKKMSIPEILGQNLSYADSKFVIKNINVKYETSIKKPTQNKVGLKISSFKNEKEETKFENLELSSAIVDKNKSTDIKLTGKVSRLNLFGLVDSTIEFKSNFDEINSKLVAVYNSIPYIYMSGQKVYEHKSFIKGMSQGLSLKMEKMTLKQGDDELELEAAYKLSNTDKDAIFSLVKQSEANLTAKGKFSLLNPLIIIEKNTTDGTELENLNNLSVDYKDSTLKVNNKIATTELSQSVIDLFKQLEEENYLNDTNNIN